MEIRRQEREHRLMVGMPIGVWEDFKAMCAEIGTKPSPMLRHLAIAWMAARRGTAGAAAPKEEVRHVEMEAAQP